MGGCSAERAVSLESGRAVAGALEEDGADVVRIEIGPDTDALRALAGARIDVAFLALHGRFGEDGCVQGLLELLRVPYTGSGVLASALAMDKLKAKELFRFHNVPTPPYYVVDTRLDADELAEAHGYFGFPAIVKPRREGSSIGVSRVENLGELAAALRSARRFDASALVERCVSGKEIAVGLLEGRVLGAIEIAPRGGLYDYAAKYGPGRAEYFLPARLGVTRIQGVLNLAERAAAAVGTRGAARVDLIVTEGQNEYVLEVNTLPGMTPQSLLPKIAHAAGYDFVELCHAMLRSAGLDSERHAAHASMEAREETAATSFEADEAAPAYAATVQRDRSVSPSQRSRTA
jgi:D-alanine-D-alanine ligase